MTKRKRIIWVLGGTGYIGRALVRHLSDDPLNQLHLLLHRHLPLRVLENVSTFTGSLARIDPLWFERYPPDVVFHLARPAGSRRLTRELSARSGKAANRHLVHLLSKLDNPPTVIYISGSLVYGPRHAKDPASENTALQPVAYARYYHQNELPWLEARQSGLLDVRFARPGWIIGPNSWFRHFFWEPLQLSGKVPIYGSGKQLMSMIHLHDGAAMIDALSIYGKRDQDLNIFAGTPIAHKTFCTMLAELTGCQTMEITEKKLRKEHGSTVAEALTASIPMQSLYPGIHAKADTRFPQPEEMLADAVRLLKDE